MDSRPLVVHHDGSVLDADTALLSQGVSLGGTLSEAKTILRDSARFVRYSEDDYVLARNHWLDFCLAYSDRIEHAMPHEAYIDLTGHPDPADLACSLVKSLGMPLECGLAPGKWVARLASQRIDECRPNIVPVRCVPTFLMEVPTASLSPVPHEHRQRLEFLGYRWVRELRAASMSVLKGQFGKDAFLIYEATRGRALDSVVPNYPLRAVSRKVCFDAPVSNSLTLDEAVVRLSAELAHDLCSHDQTAEEIRVFFEDEDGRHHMTGRKFAQPVQSATSLCVAVRALWKQALLSFPPMGVRILLSGLKRAPRGQKSLLGFPNDSERARSCESTLGCLRAAFGETVVQKAGELTVPRRELVLRAWKRATGWN